MSDTAEGEAFRTKALIGLAMAVLIGGASWFGLSSAAQRGIERLAAIDTARAQCAQSWDSARTRSDTLLVDRVPLRDTIDANSDAALSRCGDLRTLSPGDAQPRSREMSGEPMPRGLR